MIIGLAGNKGAGKNTVASMLQYLFCAQKEVREVTYQDYISEKTSPKYLDNISGFQQKAFATKVKEVLSIITGLSLDQIETLKNNGDVIPGLQMAHLYVNDSLLGIFYSEEEAVEYINRNKIEYFSLRWQNITVRFALQYIGTNLFRKRLNEDIWIKALFKEYESKYSVSIDPVEVGGKVYQINNNPIIPNWIITDVRFPNEVLAIKNKGGIIIKIKRNINTDTHESEQYIDNLKSDFILENNDNLDELFNIVKEKVFKVINLI